MTQTEFDRLVDSDVRRLIAMHAPPSVVERCAFCGGFGRVAVPVVGAALWPTRACSICAGSGVIVTEAA